MQLFVPTHKLTALLMLGLCVSVSGHDVAQTRPAPSSAGKPQAQAKTSQSNRQKPDDRKLGIGPMQFSYREIELSPGTDVVMRGPEVTMDMTDVKRGLHIVVTADNAVGHRLGDGKNTAQVNGNVRYTLTQQIPATAKTPAVTRTVEGTAQRATYAEDRQSLRLLGGVRAIINDPTRFDGPAVLRCATLSLSGDGQYEVTGDPGSTDMQFTPHVTTPPAANPKPGANGNPKTGPKSAGQVGKVHVTGFRTAHLHEKEDARFEGPLVTVETVNAQTKAQNTFKAPEIIAALQKEQRRVDAKGGIQFDNHTVDARGHAQRLEGTASAAFWSEDDGIMEANGNISAKLTNAFTLKEPATLTAGHLTAEMGDDPRYTITGPPEKTRFAFYPVPGKGRGKREKGKAASPVTPGMPTAPDKQDASPVLAANAPPAQADKQDIAGKEQADKAQDADNQDPTADAAAQDAKPTVNNPPFTFGSIVVTGFQTATYAPGDSIAVEGPKVRFTSTNEEAQNFADLSTSRLNADFDSDNAIASMTATGGVTYRFEQPVKEHKERRWIDGDGASAVFTNTEQARTIKVEGVSIIDYYTPEYLKEKAHTPFTNKDGIINYNLTTNYLKITSPSKSGTTHFTPTAPLPISPPADAKNAKKKPKRK